jgi:helicase
VAYRIVCVGVGKHEDPNIPELPGASRDARAVWALFKDNLPSTQDALLLDEQATLQRVRAALQTALGEAQDEDVVIVFFAGHGTPNHRLVMFDASDDERLNATTFAMGDLAQLFNRTRAHAAILVLDCCFSGGASARVLSTGVIARSLTNPFDLIAGQGRVLLAACASNERAWEDVESGHGLFTKALIDTLLGLTEPKELLELASRVQVNARTTARRLGLTQNPAVAGEVRGGLVVRPCERGEHFNRFFPNLSASQTDGTMASLEAFGIPKIVCDAWHGRFRGGLSALQVAAINVRGVLAGESFLVVAPTSSGKTFIGEAAAIKAALEGKKAVFLFPYKALTNEKYDAFGALYGQDLGFRVIRCTGDSTDTVDSFVRGRYDLALLTYEMFLNLLVNNPQVLAQIGLVVLDEAQFVADPTRGINVELLLTYLVTARQRGFRSQLLLLSAVIGGINHFDTWLDVKMLASTKRPVPLREGVLDRTGIYQYRDPDGSEGLEQLLPVHAIVQRKSKKGSQDIIVPLVAELLRNNPEQKVLIFRNRRGSAMGCAKYLAADLGLPPAEEALESLPSHDLSGASTSLRDALTGGAAFHTADLDPREKQLVERAFRDPASSVRVLAATTGVAAGINTPASAVILVETEFLGEESRPFTVAEVKNMAGRAGRLGFNEEGTSILLAETPFEREQLFERYVRGELAPFHSSFRETGLGTWVIKLLAQLGSVLRDDVPTLLANTYGGYLRARQNPNWVVTVRHSVEELLAEMAALDLLEVADETVSLSLLGAAVGRSSLSLEGALGLISILQDLSPGELTPISLVALLQALPEMDKLYTPMFTKGQKEKACAGEAARRYGDPIVRRLQRRVEGDPFVYLARCKRAAVLFDWMNGVPVERIETTYTVTPYQALRRGDI